MDKQQFNALSTFEQQKAVLAYRAGRSNLQCLKDVFGERVVPFSATAFHCSDGKAVFLDTSARNEQWSKPILELELTEDAAHQLRLVGMLGTLGWELREGGSSASIVQRAHRDASMVANIAPDPNESIKLGVGRSVVVQRVAEALGPIDADRD